MGNLMKKMAKSALIIATIPLAIFVIGSHFWEDVTIW